MNRACRCWIVRTCALVLVGAILPGVVQADDAASSPVEAASVESGGWRALLDGQTLKNWKKTDFGGEGEVLVREGVLIMEEGQPLTGVTWNGKPLPKSNYELEWEAKRIQGNDFFCALTFPVKEQACTLVLGGWGGGVIGLSSLNGFDASENETTDYYTFERDKWYKVRLRVTDDRVQAWLDDERIVNVDAKETQFDIRIEVEPNRPFGISTFQTEGGIRNLRIRELPTRPNLIFIVADDLGYGDPGCYGQQIIKTPRLDRMAAEGMKFRNFYAGATVCAPSRSVLMTGQHMGHTHVRGNAGSDLSTQALRDEDVTVAEVLKEAGYATGLYGKWGLGDDVDGARSGLPRKQGFDRFFGYLNQRHAHNYYPEFLWRNEEKVPLRNEVKVVSGGGGGFAGGYATKRVDYSHDLIVDESLNFVREKKDQPFFLYLALTIPHANNEGTRGTGNGQEVPDYGPYADYDWPEPDKGQAAMITRMDRDIGRLLDLLVELEIDHKTVVMFTSDNGPHREGGQNPDRFDPNGPLRGFKRDLYEGGIRVPLIVRWPGTVPADTVADHIAYFGDLMATASELAGVEPPKNVDSISFVPTITGHAQEQKAHDFLYWEFYELGGAQAVRQGDWKAVRVPMHTGPIELYNLSTDLGESTNIASEHPERVRELELLMQQAHRPHPNWKPRGQPPKRAAKPGDGQPRF